VLFIGIFVWMKQHSYWNDFVLCKAEALKYQTRKEFGINSSSAYNAARRNGWLDTICGHMQSNRVKQGHWESFQNCQSEALKYKTKSQFSKGSPGAYQSAYLNGWLNKICTHFDLGYKAKGYWDLENCKKEALKYSSKSEFSSISKSAYQAAHRFGWLDSICQHMELKRKEKGHWTYENCAKEAKKYIAKSVFQKKGRGAFAAAKKNGWVKEICSHMKVQGNGYLRYGYALEFPVLNQVYIGITSNPNRRKWQHISSKDGNCISSNKYVRLNINNNESFNWIVFDDLSDKSNAKEFEEKLISIYVDKGWVVLNIAEAGALGSNRKFWTKQRCAKEAKKYSSKSEFAQNSSSAYNSARENGWTDMICGHMVSNKKPNGFWNDKEKCTKEALKYNRKVDFQKGSPSAYNVAKENGWLDEIRSHMVVSIKPVGYWKSKERCQKEAIKFISRSDFQKLSGSAYASAQKNGWVEDICKHMIEKRKEKGFWDFEQCKKEARKYKTRTEFSIKSSSAYNTSKQNKWLDIICTHMISSQHKHGYWTIEKCTEAAAPYRTRMEFKKADAKGYDAARSKGWLNEIFSQKK